MLLSVGNRKKVVEEKMRIHKQARKKEGEKEKERKQIRLRDRRDAMVGDKLKGLRCRATAYLTFLNRRGIRVRDYLIIVNKNGDFFFFFFYNKT